MKLYLDTSTDTCLLRLDHHEYSKNLGRDMAEQILSFIFDKLQENNADWEDITEVTCFSSPGSFTGLRIGAAIANVLSAELHIPLYNHLGERCQVILPDYGRPANISKPKD